MNGMRISGSTQAVSSLQNTPQTDSVRTAYQINVLKKALDSQKAQASKLLELIETKGQVVDIRA